MSHWVYKGQVLEEIPDGVEGFIYRITNNVSGRKYIGRKYFYRVKRKAIKNSTRRRVITKSSDWRTYTGSNKTLSEDIKTLGKNNFTFEILAFGYTKGQVNFLEENVQHRLGVLTDSSYYNDSIGSRKYIGVKIDDAFKDILRGIDL